jgi:hypothetical protein
MDNIELSDIAENVLLLLVRRSGGTVRIPEEEWENHNGIWEKYTFAITFTDGEYIVEMIKRP